MQVIKQGLCSVLETALNELLVFDPAYEQRWQVMESKTIALHIKDWQLEFVIRYQNTRFSVLTESSQSPDVTLSGNSWDFFKLAVEQQQDDAAALGSNIYFDGQVSVGQTFAKCLQSVNIDWEELLSGPLGDIGARRANNLLAGLGSWLTEVVQTTEKHFTEFVQEEARLAPTAIEVENFYADLRILRADCDRLAARIERLKTRDTD